MSPTMSALVSHLSRSRLSGLSIRVALALLSLAESDGIVRAGVRQIARVANPSADIRHHVRRALRELEAAGLVRCLARGAPGRRDTTLVAITWSGASGPTPQAGCGASGPTPQAGCGASGPTPQAGCGANGPTPQAGCGASGPTPQAGCGANGPTPPAGCGASGPTPQAVAAPPSPHTPLPPEKTTQVVPSTQSFQKILAPEETTQVVPSTQSSQKILAGEKKKREKGFPKESAASGQTALPLQAPSPPGPSETLLEDQEATTRNSPPPGPEKTGLEGKGQGQASPARLARQLCEKWSGLDPNTALRAVKAAASQGRGAALVAEVISSLETQDCPADPVARLVALCSHTMRLKVQEQEEQVALEAIPEPLREIVADFLRRHGLPVARLASEAAAMLREIPLHRMLVALGAAQGTGWEAWRQVREIARNGLRDTAATDAAACATSTQNTPSPQVLEVRQVFEQEYRDRGMLVAWDPVRDDAKIAQLLQWLSDGGVSNPVDILRRALRWYFHEDAKASAAGYPVSWFLARATQYVNLVLKDDHFIRQAIERAGKKAYF